MITYPVKDRPQIDSETVSRHQSKTLRLTGIEPVSPTFRAGMLTTTPQSELETGSAQSPAGLSCFQLDEAYQVSPLGFFHPSWRGLFWLLRGFFHPFSRDLRGGIWVRIQIIQTPLTLWSLWTLGHLLGSTVIFAWRDMGFDHVSCEG